MEILHKEKFSNSDNHLFEFRIIDWHTHKETVIDLLLLDNGRERGVNVQKYIDSSETPLNELIEKAKAVIILINILEGLGDVSKDVDLFKA